MRLAGMIRKHAQTSSKLLAYLQGLLLVMEVSVPPMEWTVV